MKIFKSKIEFIKWFVAENRETYETGRYFYMRIYANDHHDIIIRRSKINLDLCLGWTEVAHVYPDHVVTCCKRGGEYMTFNR